MNKKIMVMLAACSGLAACTANDLPVLDDTGFAKNGVFIQGHTYNSLPLRSCLTFAKCTSRISLMPDGQGVITSLDRDNHVTYSIQNGRITTTRVGAGDISEKLEFDILTAAMALVQRDTKTKFNLHSTLVEVYKPTGARQCEPDSGTSLTRSQEILTSSGIEITANACGQITGVAYPAVCGGGTSSVNIHVINDDQPTLQAAKDLGFIPLSQSNNPIEKTTCP